MSAYKHGEAVEVRLSGQWMPGTVTDGPKIMLSGCALYEVAVCEGGATVYPRVYSHDLRSPLRGSRP